MDVRELFHESCPHRWPEQIFMSPRLRIKNGTTPYDHRRASVSRQDLMPLPPDPLSIYQQPRLRNPLPDHDVACVPFVILAGVRIAIVFRESPRMR